MLYSTREPAEIDKLADVTREIREFVQQEIRGLIVSPWQTISLHCYSGWRGPRCGKSTYLIAELQTLREKLQNDETRVQRAIVKYTTLSQSTLHSTKVISECLANWKQSSRRPEHGTVSAD